VTKCSEEHTVGSHVLLPLLWDVGNVDVVVDGLTEVVERLSKLMSLWGVLEFFESTLELMGLNVLESSVES